MIFVLSAAGVFFFFDSLHSRMIYTGQCLPIT